MATPSTEDAWGIRFEDVSVRYPNGTLALDRVSIDIAPGEIVAIVGLSGSGKSTFIRCINGLIQPTSGRVFVGPHEISAANGASLRKLRGHIGMIFQEFNLADRASVFSNTLVGRFSHNPTWRTILGLSTAADKAEIAEALDQVGILDKAWNKAGALSGGQKQRVAIARTLAQKPGIMLADEPVASLDPPTAHSVMQDLQRINAQRGLTTLVNLHLVDLAQQYATRIVGIRNGHIVFDGAAADSELADFEEIYGRKIQENDQLGSTA
ncbi:phosphonate ABC transporter ATP-binding protein [Corynebacterium macginleyi]|uniref:Phosphonate ABC transporter ATP-binding protein n=1 Tax=Corynebacterium macginleyi TaxID=38290 RepID=A0A3M0G0Z2_9CORY|nr:phosphonate ABC transporter ATP-binding protein [Corynebacterium macginleyi]MBK4138216.1 phosphonate ABC transporter ATP-binding protein [Corynebacterium macginleyi]MBK4150976.1 phosphonate ABC transporter ATP-binding protein [Corynebacterium macginleyi]MBK4152799.1 phosphonate ABC transporter ATP-binding protein [Corynebacterium macginleyi]MBK4156488.1 phosphonate ABC transporter ATP-binding protein [Corynebacterium macginleyi]MBK4160753.1 phosphonate ABC transporter ATP-binding protein [C